MKRMHEVREEIRSHQGEVGLVQNDFRYELLERKSLLIENESQLLKEEIRNKQKLVQLLLWRNLQLTTFSY